MDMTNCSGPFGMAARAAFVVSLRLLLAGLLPAASAGTAKLASNASAIPAIRRRRTRRTLPRPDVPEFTFTQRNNGLPDAFTDGLPKDRLQPTRLRYAVSVACG